MNRLRTIGRCRSLLAAVTAFACGFATSACAEVHVEGDLNGLRVAAKGDTLSDVFSAIDSLLHVKYRTAVPLDAQISAVYSGSLSQVVSRLLDGYNYVIKKDPDRIEIIVFGKRGEVALPPKTPVAKGALSRWR
jgi:hypothetical protein